MRRAAREAEAAQVLVRRQRAASRRGSLRRLNVLRLNVLRLNVLRLGGSRLGLVRAGVRSSGRTGKLYPRRTRAQRTGIVVVATVALAAIWFEVDSLSTKIALTAFAAVCAPVLIVLTLDRRI
jgi:hypothetical protein